MGRCRTSRQEADENRGRAKRLEEERLAKAGRQTEKERRRAARDIVHVHILPPGSRAGCSLVVIEEAARPPGLAPDSLAALFGLTPPEARLALLPGRGDSLADCERRRDFHFDRAGPVAACVREDRHASAGGACRPAAQPGPSRRGIDGRRLLR